MSPDALRFAPWRPVQDPARTSRGAIGAVSDFVRSREGKREGERENRKTETVSLQQKKKKKETENKEIGPPPEAHTITITADLRILNPRSISTSNTDVRPSLPHLNIFITIDYHHHHHQNHHYHLHHRHHECRSLPYLPSAHGQQRARARQAADWPRHDGPGRPLQHRARRQLPV